MFSRYACPGASSCLAIKPAQVRQKVAGRKELFNEMVQLGGFEPPTSCSTDRRSNQLSYNCILCGGPKKGSANGPETRCNASLWQVRQVTQYRSSGGRNSFKVRKPPTPGSRQNRPPAAKSPGQPPGLFVMNTGKDQAAGL